MKAMKNLMDFFTGKKTIVRENVGGSSTYLLDRVSLLSNRYGRNFFHQSIICCAADAFEYFLEIDKKNNFFYQNILLMTAKTSEKFIKWESAYHTLMFTKDLTKESDVNTLEVALFFVFEFSDEEKERYYSFKEALVNDEGEFAERFSSESAVDIFDIIEINNFDASFIYNFYYSCYTEFYRVFTKYAVVDNNSKDSDNICLSVLQTSK